MLAASCLQATNAMRESDFNFDWKFKLLDGIPANLEVPLDDADWRDIRLPHDWSVEASFDENLEGCTGYLPGGVAWYQKHFPSPDDSEQSNTYILFDGVYNNAKFWVNGKYLGENPYGYSPVFFDLSEHLTTDGSDNIISVYVDHSRYADSRWYTGSGIYRNVKLVTVDKLHIPIWGTFVTTPEIGDDKAIVQLETTVENKRSKKSKFSLATRIVAPCGKVVAETNDEYDLGSGKDRVYTQSLVVKDPMKWDLDSPNMYQAVTTISERGNVIDEYVTSFGIRTIEFDKDTGFFLNGRNTYVKGVCIHHDGGLVGAAVPEGVWRRRLEILKKAGVNAIRTSHNPFSAEFMDLCDEMGFLVQNEIFDEMDNPKDKRWNMNEERSKDYITRGYHEHFQEWAHSDLKRTMLRDRNHPSVFQWSIGNEIEWTYPHYKYISGHWDPEVKNYWNRIPHLTPEEMEARYAETPEREYVLTETAQRLANWVRELDTTRPVTSNLIIPVASHATGYSDTLDIVGFSYQTNQYDWSKKNYPQMHHTGNENTGSWHDWDAIVEDPMVFSMYMWTGIDYLGEANEKWPQKGWDGDMLDFAAFKKQGWNYWKSVWVDEPHISLGTLPVEGSEYKVDDLSGKPILKGNKVPLWRNTNMHWNYKEGEMILVEVCSNQPEVELFLNGRSLGVRSLAHAPDRILRWAVPFEAGTLHAKAVSKGQPVCAIIETASDPVSIRLTADKSELSADGYDVAHVIAQLLDEDGNVVKTEDARLTFEVDGEVTILGVDNGSNRSVQDYQANELVTSQGRGMILIQSKRTNGAAVVKATANGMNGSSVRIEIN